MKSTQPGQGHADHARGRASASKRTQKSFERLRARRTDHILSLQHSFEAFPKPRNKAGRNLPVAIAVGVGLMALVLVAVLMGSLAWFALVAVAIAVATWEVTCRLRENGYIVPDVLLLIVGQLMVWSSYFFGASGLVASFVASALMVMFARLFYYGRKTPPRNYLRDTSISIFVMVWIPLFASFAALLSVISDDHVRASFFIFTFMACVIASDTGGFISGVMFGSRPMAPAVSPKKSWEGFIGSLVFGTAVGTLIVALVLDHYWWMGTIMGAILVVCATLGDLVESQFKREMGIKDMSNLLPGHGGLMDRLDGMLPSAMVTWVILTLVG